MMARVDLSWEDQAGGSQSTSGMLEDRSTHGASIRLRMPVHVGCKVSIRWPKGPFTGLVRNCRKVKGDYVIGVQQID